jgi:hypothetical protein
MLMKCQVADYDKLAVATAAIARVFVELKAESAAATRVRVSRLRATLAARCASWRRWTASCPEKRRAPAHLDASDDITAESRHAADQTNIGIAVLRERACVPDVFLDTSLGVHRRSDEPDGGQDVDFVINDPTNADCVTAFDALWSNACLILADD